MGKQRLRLGALAVGVAMLVSGCWTQDGGGPAQRFHNPFEFTLTPAVVDDLEVSWSAPGRALGTFGNSLLLADGRSIRSLSVVNGAQQWSTTLPGTSATDVIVLTSLVSIGADLWVSWIGTHTGWARLAGATGAILADGTDQRLIMGGSDQGLVVADISSYPYAGSVLDPATGAVRFSMATALDTPAWPAVGGGRVITEDHLGNVQAYDIDGCGAPTCAPIWSIDLGDAVATQFALSDDGTSAYVAIYSFPAEVLRVDTSTGGISGHMQLTGSGGTARFAVADGHVFAATPERLEVFDATCTGTCAPTWSAGLLPAYSIGEPVVGAGVVHVPGAGGITSYATAGCGAAACEPLSFLDTDQDATELIVASGRIFATRSIGPAYSTTAYALS